MVRARHGTSAVVKVKSETHRTLQEIAREDDRPMGEIITYLVERYERERFWEKAANDLARLRSDEDAWQAYRNENCALDAVIPDSLAAEPPFFTTEEEEQIRGEIAAASESR